MKLTADTPCPFRGYDHKLLIDTLEDSAGTMADVLSTHPHGSMDMARDNVPSVPLPNPPFVFPLQPDTVNESNSHSGLPSAAGNTISPRSGARSRPHKISLNALPAFEFGAPASSPTKSSPSPSRSPSRRTPPISHAGAGHRRNGSEYIGGDITHGGPMLVSTSPTRSDYSSGHRRNGSEFVGAGVTGGGPMLVNTDPTNSEGSSNLQLSTRLGPPPVKRGHAHRRSGAISSHDLSAIIKPPTDSKAESAPATPSDPMFQNVQPPELDRSTSQPVLSTAIQESSPPSLHQEKSIGEGQERPRARFSEKIDYYSPRPLSTISSETSSSMSTIRANHSVSNSISSIVSASISSSPPNIYQTLRRGHVMQESERDQVRLRPKTAEASSRPPSGDWDWGFVDGNTSTKRPSSAPSSESPSKETQHPIVDSALGASISSKQTLGDLFSKSAKTVSLSKPVNNQLSKRRPISPTMRPRTSPEPKVTKRQRKGRSWAGLLSRRGKPQDLKEGLTARRSPTPPLRQPSMDMEFSFDDINFDEDTTYIIEADSPSSSRVPTTQTHHTDWKPRASSPLSETDNSASVLDIDAALGSFDMETFGPSFEDAIGGGGSSNVKRPMHSSGITGVFAGPGMHYHRRTESAPEMDAVDRSRFGFPRLGSNPAMAIEEEEEEEDEEDEKTGPPGQMDEAVQIDEDRGKGSQASGLGVNIVEAEHLNEQPMRRAQRRPVKAPRLKQVNYEELSPVEIVEADEEPRFSVITKSSDESTITPTISPDRLDRLPLPTHTDFTMPTPALTYGTPDTASAISSPDFTRTSFDGPRVHTATSSITDRTTLNSSRAGDQGLGLHSSIDDVPSLTSSASITSAHPTRCSISANSAADRSSSLSAAVPARTRPVSAHKRLSLASLSRLAGSSYNRSKLNIEESAPVESVERPEKKKGNRISRMMKFWKSKEKLSSS